jgi:hypothetical protein
VQIHSSRLGALAHRFQQWTNLRELLRAYIARILLLCSILQNYRPEETSASICLDGHRRSGTKIVNRISRISIHRDSTPERPPVGGRVEG